MNKEIEIQKKAEELLNIGAQAYREGDYDNGSESPDHLRLNQNLLLLTNHYQLWMFPFRHKLFNSWNTSRRLEI